MFIKEQQDLGSDALDGVTKPKAPRARWLPIMLLGIPLTVLNVLWMTYLENVYNQGYATLLSIYYNVVFTIVLVVLLNGLVRRWKPAWALSQGEILCIFIMGTMGNSIASMVQLLVAVLPYPYHYSEMDSRWGQYLIPHLSRWLTVHDPEASRAFYLGAKDGVNWSLIKPWVFPFVGWGVFTMATVVTGICLTALVYNRWRYQEKLAFPLTQIPLAITQTESRGAFYRSWLFWIGFAIAASIDINNALSQYYPTVPLIPVKQQVVFVPGLDRPWSAVQPFFYSLNPMLIGIQFFLPVDFLFSVFFFYWAGQFQAVLMDLMGQPVTGYFGGVPDHMRQQALGAIIALLILSLRISRVHWRESWQRHSTILRPDTASAGAVLGAMGMVGVLIFSGMPKFLAVAFVIVYLVIVTSLARIRAQAGPPNVGLLLTAPSHFLYGVFGKQVLGHDGLASLAQTHWVGREFAGHPMILTAEAFALTEGRASRRTTAWTILAGTAVGYAAAFAIIVAIGYIYGVGTAKAHGIQCHYGNEAYQHFSARVADSNNGPSTSMIGNVTFGGVVCAVLQMLRMRFPGFALNPVGYAVGGTYISVWLWSTAFITWIFKLLLMRYMGLKGYYAAVPFFLGLVLGEFVVGSLVSLIGIAMGVPPYVIWPY